MLLMFDATVFGRPNSRPTRQHLQWGNHFSIRLESFQHLWSANSPQVPKFRCCSWPKNKIWKTSYNVVLIQEFKEMLWVEKRLLSWSRIGPSPSLELRRVMESIAGSLDIIWRLHHDYITSIILSIFLITQHLVMLSLGASTVKWTKTLLWYTTIIIVLVTRLKL